MFAMPSASACRHAIPRSGACQSVHGRPYQLYSNVRGHEPTATPMSTSEAVRTMRDAVVGSPAQVPAGFDAQMGLYRSLLAGRRMLVVLDNAHDTNQVRPLLPGSLGCLVIVTSRDLGSTRRNSGLHCRQINVRGDRRTIDAPYGDHHDDTGEWSTTDGWSN